MSPSNRSDLAAPASQVAAAGGACCSSFRARRQGRRGRRTGTCRRRGSRCVSFCFLSSYRILDCVVHDAARSRDRVWASHVVAALCHRPIALWAQTRCGFLRWHTQDAICEQRRAHALRYRSVTNQLQRLEMLGPRSSATTRRPCGAQRLRAVRTTIRLLLPILHVSSKQTFMRDATKSRRLTRSLACALRSRLACGA